MKKILYLPFLLILSISCTDIISYNVSDSVVEIIGPSDSLFTSQQELTFWWEENDSVESYRFQLVSPDYSQATFVFDTVLNGNQIAFLLDEGIYKWRIRMENASSKSAYQERFLVIDATPPAMPEILFPMDGDTLERAPQITLQWRSFDPDVQGMNFGVIDSVFVYEYQNGLMQLREKARLTGSGVKNHQLGLDGGIDYVWEIISFDKTMNKSGSSQKRFWLE